MYTTILLPAQENHTTLMKEVSGEGCVIPVWMCLVKASRTKVFVIRTKDKGSLKMSRKVLFPAPILPSTETVYGCIGYAAMLLQGFLLYISSKVLELVLCALAILLLHCPHFLGQTVVPLASVKGDLNKKCYSLLR